MECLLSRERISTCKQSGKFQSSLRSPSGRQWPLLAGWVPQPQPLPKNFWARALIASCLISGECGTGSCMRVSISNGKRSESARWRQPGQTSNRRRTTSGQDFIGGWIHNHELPITSVFRKREKASRTRRGHALIRICSTEDERHYTVMKSFDLAMNIQADHSHKYQRKCIPSNRMSLAGRLLQLPVTAKSAHYLPARKAVGQASPTWPLVHAYSK